MASAIADRFPLSDRLSPNTYSALIGPAEAGDDAKTRTAVRSRDRIRIATDLREFVDADDSRVRSACEIKVVRVPRLETGGLRSGGAHHLIRMRSDRCKSTPIKLLEIDDQGLSWSIADSVVIPWQTARRLLPPRNAMRIPAAN